jgi:hypothetical protein
MNKNRRKAREDFITNLPLAYEPDAGQDNAPFFLLDDNDEDRPFPNLDPWHENNNMVDANRESRIERLARILVNLA